MVAHPDHRRRSRGETRVDSLVRAVLDDIFTRRVVPGERLPSMRALARTHDVTLPTAQRAVARLKEIGVLDVRHGSGMTVRDPALHAGPEVVPYWIDAVRERPDEATRVMADFLELRRELAVGMLRQLATLRPRPELASVSEAVDALEHAVEDAEVLDESHDERLLAIAEADLDVARAFLRLRPQIAFGMIFNVLARLLHTLPALRAAIYATPEENVRGYRAVVAALGERSSDPDWLAALVRQTLETLDAAAIERFGRGLRAQNHDALDQTDSEPIVSNPETST